MSSLLPLGLALGVTAGVEGLALAVALFALRIFFADLVVGAIAGHRSRGSCVAPADHVVV